MEMSDKPGGSITNRGSSPSKKMTDRTVVMSAIRHLKNPRGCSFADIKKYVCSELWANYDQSDLKRLKLYMTKAVESGVLIKVDSRYIIKAAAKPKAMSSRLKNPAKGVRKTGAGLKMAKPPSRKQKSVGKSPTKSSAKRRSKSPARVGAKSPSKIRTKSPARVGAKSPTKIRTKSPRKVVPSIQQILVPDIQPIIVPDIQQTLVPSPQERVVLNRQENSQVPEKMARRHEE